MVKLALEAIEAASCGCTLRDFEALVVSTTPMIEDAMEDVMKIIRGEVKLKETDDDQAALMGYGVACQSLGFQNGFRLAVRMMAEYMMD